MSITDWINRILGFDGSKNNFNLPSEYQVPTENNNVNKHTFGGNEFFNTDRPSEFSLPTEIHDFNMHNFGPNSFGAAMDMFEEMLKDFELEFSMNNKNNENHNRFYMDVEDDIFNRPLNEIEYNEIPKKNFEARNYFLNKPSPAPRTLDELPIRITVSPGMNFGQASTRSFMSTTYNGRKIEKETSTKQLQGGITEKVIVLKDGDQKCITTITENLKTGEQNCNKQLVNLDESQLNEFENRFSKFR